MGVSATGTVNALTIDVEDYYHVSGFAREIPSRTWSQYESRVEKSTQRILDILDRRQVRATFFVLGWVASRHPDLVKAIHRSGHEIASHSYWHRLVYDLTPDEFRADLSESRKPLEDLTGERITAYRAPSFSVTGRSLWALEILAEEGFRYDSSIFPVRHDRYGIPAAERFPHRITSGSGHLWEFPASVYRRIGVNLPVAGGGYFRLYPTRFSFHCMDHINHQERRPFMFYLHPWELDPRQPVIPGSRWARFRHRVNLAGTETKFERLLERYRFGAMGEVLDAHHSASDSNRAPVVPLEGMRARLARPVGK